LKFLDELDNMIKGADKEILKLDTARIKKDYHVNFVTDRINKGIEALTKENPEDPVKVLGSVLSMVPDFISEGFDLINRSHRDLLVSKQTMVKIRDGIQKSDEEGEEEEEPSALVENGQSKKKSSRKKPKQRKTSDRPSK